VHFMVCGDMSRGGLQNPLRSKLKLITSSGMELSLKSSGHSFDEGCDMQRRITGWVQYELPTGAASGATRAFFSYGDSGYELASFGGRAEWAS
jgi:hypothetical protein